MALIFEDFADSAKSKKIPIPKKTADALAGYKDNLETSIGKGQDINMFPGGGVLKKWSSKTHYNERGSDKKKNGSTKNAPQTITPNDANVFLTRRKKSIKSNGVNSPKNFIYNSKAGELMKQTAEKVVAAGRREGQKVQPVKPVKPNAVTATKPAQIKTKEISAPNGKITFNVTTENRIITEGVGDAHAIYEYMNEYGPYYVLSEFFSNPNGKQDWGVLINPDMYAKALREFTKYGKLVKFPGKYVYQWMGIIMKNTVILEADTDLAGHSMNFPYDEVIDFAESEGVELDNDYNVCSEWLDEQGLYDWMQMPDQSDAWSDYGLKPLYSIISEYDESLPPEKVLVLVNRALDVSHTRGDLSSIFITGGSRSLDMVAENIKRDCRKVIFTENQLLVLKRC